MTPLSVLLLIVTAAVSLSMSSPVQGAAAPEILVVAPDSSGSGDDRIMGEVLSRVAELLPELAMKYHLREVWFTPWAMPVDVWSLPAVRVHLPEVPVVTHESPDLTFEESLIKAIVIEKRQAEAADYDSRLSAGQQQYLEAIQDSLKPLIDGLRSYARHSHSAPCTAIHDLMQRISLESGTARWLIITDGIAHCEGQKLVADTAVGQRCRDSLITICLIPESESVESNRPIGKLLSERAEFLMKVAPGAQIILPFDLCWHFDARQIENKRNIETIRGGGSSP